ncbi:hypothetical protein L210DRAFT_3508028 [Boletus edulis BED1]|uniref:HNH nuclease domain-containing protein n=1 Tax=Boletus edulis BED1 TaxID=1328754 RepID=A0AAD4BI88_BOLED|nr:hypothetical protein L210DRAFT_3508028 [Boletus edulis BED1]
MVNIHVRREDNGEWVRGLAIPLEDIQRFSLRPLKWLRFVAFAVLGAKGDLFDAFGAGRNIVNYDTVSVTDADGYYFFPDGNSSCLQPSFTDKVHSNRTLPSRRSQGLADKITASTVSTISTSRHHDFRHDVAKRDNKRCVIKGTTGKECHAAHIIPHSKGNRYIRLVISDRRSLYEDQQVDLLSDLNINSPENGMFLSTELHSRFGRGASAFLKTPNFALKPEDIPWVEPGKIPASRTTIQHFESWDPEDQYPVLQGNVRVDWTVVGAPLSILLDYTYGVAVIQRWATADILNLLEKHHEIHYKIQPDDNDVLDDDPADPEYVPSETVYHCGIHQTRTEAAQCRAIDTAIAFSMFIKGYPPGTTIDMLLQKQEEEAEMRSRQVAREKVQGWLETTGSGSSPFVTVLNSLAVLPINFLKLVTCYNNSAPSKPNLMSHLFQGWLR